jgi:hypothetical protein
LDLQVIAITKNIENPCPDYYIVVHGDWKRDPATGHNAPCVAKCNWVRDVKQIRVIRSLGRMPAEKLNLVVDTLDRIYKDPNFQNWI